MIIIYNIKNKGRSNTHSYSSMNTNEAHLSKLSYVVLRCYGACLALRIVDCSLHMFFTRDWYKDKQNGVNISIFVLSVMLSFIVIIYVKYIEFT